MIKTLHYDEKGQAVAEMAVCMIAIMAVFLGVIFAFAIGSTNIDNLISCRAEADNYAYSQVYGDAGTQIFTWNEGPDERMFTNDDQPVYGADYDPDLFRGELQTAEVDLVNDLNEAQTPNNFAADLADVNALFLKSANLTSYKIVSDPYVEMELEDLRGAFSFLFFSSDLNIENAVYMPIMDDVVEQEEGEY